MGNIQANEKQAKTGKSPSRSKHFMRNLNRKSPGRESRKHGRKKSDAKRDAIDTNFDKTPDSDINEPIETSDNDMVECVFKTLKRDEEGVESSSVQSEVTVTRCEQRAEPRSPTRDRPPPAVAPPAAAASPANDSTSESVFTDPLTPLAAVELNQCYYSAESDSALEDLPRTLTPSQEDTPAPLVWSPIPITVDMPHDDAASSLPIDDIEKEEKSDVFDDSCDRGENEKVMGALLSGSRGEQLERGTHECSHDFRDNRLKASPGQTSFTISKHRKVELPPVACEPSLNLLENAVVVEKDRRHSSVSDAPVAESNVLRKVASLTLDKLTESRVVRPKFVPDKLDFRLYEKFEGQMLLNWFLSSVAENNHLKSLLNSQDLKNFGIHYCTHLLAAGVLRQIADRDAPTENIFKPNLMYYWAHTEVPASQPVTPGRLHMTAWPPDREPDYMMQEQVTNRIENNRFFNQNNNEEISDLSDAKIVISQLKMKLQELEFQIEKYKINTQIESLNRNLERSFDTITEYNISKKTDLISKEVQTTSVSNELKLSNKPVINIPEYDPLRSNVNNEKTLDISSIECKNEMVIKHYENKADIRSEKIENYCKLNKSRECNKSFRRDELSDNDVDDEELRIQDVKKEPPESGVVDHLSNNTNLTSNSTTCDSSSDASFLSSYTSTDILNNRNASAETSLSDLNKKDDVFSKHDTNLKNVPVTQILYTHVDKKACPMLETRLSTPELLNNTEQERSAHIGETHEKANVENQRTVLETLTSQESIMGHPPPPLPGMPPPPPPMPGTDLNSYASPETDTVAMVPEPEMEPSQTPKPVMGALSSPIPGIDSTSPPILGVGPPPPPMPGLELILGMGPPPPPMPEMGPPPPPMLEMGPPPPPMPEMGPPPPPMPGMGPPPPPMPGLGPPPPPMPGMGPPPPPMPGMGPPPPPMPGMGPPPPPMFGMGPPPPPMSGMGPPPMAGMGPPPPPGMPGVGPGPPPPPPNLGPAPFPAPPVGGWNMQRATLRKTPVKPAAPMKPLYWTRILAIPVAPTCLGESNTNLKPLWLEIEETKLDNIEEFTDLFSRQVVKAPVKKKVEVKTKIQPIKILDSKRSQNVGILAQSLHVEFSEIENAVYNFDTSVVTLEALQQIYELRASEEELGMIKEHLASKPDIPLDKPEAFLHDLSGIPNFAERISCFMFQAEFEDAVSTTMHKLDNLKHTCEFLITSEPLKKLFAIILTLGNYMNGGNGQRGQADGFGLEILAKLKDVKSKQSNVTLLHFIVRTYMRACGGAMSDTCLLPVPEPGDVVRAATLDFADVAANLTTLRNQLTACNEKTKKVIETDANSRNHNEEPSSGEGTKRLEVFKDKMTIFLNAAEEKLKTENENLEECRTKFIATVKFYQYTPKCGKIEECEPKEFFSLWTSFCSDFKDIYKKEEQIAVKEKLKEAKKMQEERKSMTQTQPKKEGGLKSRLQKLSSTRK